MIRDLRNMSFNRIRGQSLPTISLLFACLFKPNLLCLDSQPRSCFSPFSRQYLICSPVDSPNTTWWTNLFLSNFLSVWILFFANSFLIFSHSWIFFFLSFVLFYYFYKYRICFREALCLSVCFILKNKLYYFRCCLWILDVVFWELERHRSKAFDMQTKTERLIENEISVEKAFRWAFRFK